MVQVYQRQIDRATHAIENAKSDAESATAYSDRGRGYSDKARLSWLRHQIDREEYLRLYALALADHDRAVALAPGDAHLYYDRGRSSYDRGASIEGIDADRTPWMDAARRDFTAAVEKNPRDAVSYDFLGLVEQQTGRFDEAVAAYTRVMELDPRWGRVRLSELHCTQGQSHLQAKEFELAAAELEKSVALDARGDSCSCEPYNSLAYVYIDATAQYDKAWDLVRRALASGHVIAPEYLLQLETASGKKGV